MGIADHCILEQENYGEPQASLEIGGQGIAFIRERRKLGGTVKASHWLRVGFLIGQGEIFHSSGCM